MVDDTHRRVLNTLLAQTNDRQGEWTSLSALRTTLSANGNVHHDDVENALRRLRADGLVERRDGERLEYRPADGVERVPYPGEVRA